MMFSAPLSTTTLCLIIKNIYMVNYTNAYYFASISVDGIITSLPYHACQFFEHSC